MVVGVGGEGDVLGLPGWSQVGIVGNLDVLGEAAVDLEAVARLRNRRIPFGARPFSVWRATKLRVGPWTEIRTKAMRCRALLA